MKLSSIYNYTISLQSMKIMNPMKSSLVCSFLIKYAHLGHLVKKEKQKQCSFFIKAKTSLYSLDQAVFEEK